MRLATLLTSLIQESSKGVLSGVAGMVEKEGELLAALDGPAASLAGDAAVQDYLREHFPPLDAGQSGSNALSHGFDGTERPDTAIRPGAPYIRPDDYEHAAEFPPITEKLGLELRDEELHTQDGTTRLSQQAVDRIERTVRQRLGSDREDILTHVIERGVPVPKVTDLEVGVSIAFEDDLDVSVVSTSDDVAPASVGHLTARLEFEEHWHR